MSSIARRLLPHEAGRIDTSWKTMSHSQKPVKGLNLEPRSGTRTAAARAQGADREPSAMGRTLPTLRRAWPKDGPLAAICVQNVDVQCVLQFTLIHAAGCVLHRRTSQVIHRLKLYSFQVCSQVKRVAAGATAPRHQHWPSQPPPNHRFKRSLKNCGKKGN